MKLQAKLLFSFGLVLIVIFTGIEFFGYQQARQQVFRELRQNAREIRNILMATRRVYHHQFINSGVPVNNNTLGFLPAHALSRISDDFLSWSDSGLTFNNVTDRPRNPSNQADEIELKAIAHFRASPNEKERMISLKDKQGDDYYHFSAPIWVEEYCLECHGKSNDAPETISKTYNTSFDYKLGELRGLMSIKLPITLVQQEIIGARLQMVWKHVLGFALAFLFGALLLRRWVINRLAPIHSATEALANGNYAIRIPVHGQDELSDVAVAFNAMAERRQQAEKELSLERNNLRNILDCMEDGIYIVNSQFDIQYVNSALENEFGPYEGGKCYKYLHDREEVCPWCKNQEMQAGNTIQWEWSFTNNGKTYDLLDSPITLPDGSRGKLEIFRDITERKKIELELKSYREQLEEQVKERTTELEAKNATLERMNDLFSGREFRIKELRDRIKQLEAEKG